MRRVPRSMGLVVVILATGCGSGSLAQTPDATASNAPRTDAAAVEAPDAAGLCALATPSSAPVITDTYTSSAMPTMTSLTGGTIAPGTYYHVQQINFGAATGPVHTRQTTVVVDASGSTAILTGMIDTMPLVAAERLEFSGNILTMKIACPSELVGMIDTVGYNAGGGMLYMYAYDENTESVFELQH